MAAAETNRNLYEGRNHRTHFASLITLSGIALSGSHNFVQNFGGRIEPFADV
jgi:hypothetical protein